MIRELKVQQGISGLNLIQVQLHSKYTFKAPMPKSTKDLNNEHMKI